MCACVNVRALDMEYVHVYVRMGVVKYLTYIFL